MSRLPGWGLLLILMLPLLIYFSVSGLGSEKARVNLDRYHEWGGSEAAVLIQPLQKHYLRHRQPAVAGDITLPPVPARSGVKAWVLNADSSLLVTLDAKVDGREVQLHYVPIVRGPSSLFYDCVSNTSPSHVRRFCRGEILKSVADVPAQLSANAEVLARLRPVETASGASLAAGAPLGSVLVMPATPQDLNDCGFQCVKPQSCVTPRPLACARSANEGGGSYLEVRPTFDSISGSQLATRGAADAACAQALGTGFKLVTAGSLGGKFDLRSGYEYWVHNDVRREQNCWVES